MSQPREPDPVKLVSSLFSPEKTLIDRVVDDLADLFGPVDWKSPELVFDRTEYYAREMGWPLYRRFISFARLIPPDHLVEAKLRTNDLEQQYAREGKRRVNIDPGYICAERLILATGKNYVHRVYLARGIYADLTLIFKRGGFIAVDWTYPDYADSKTREFFNEVRNLYMEQIREMRRID